MTSAVVAQKGIDIRWPDPDNSKEAQIVIERWRKHYNTIRPHSSLGCRPPAPQTSSPLPPPFDQPHSLAFQARTWRH
jgi:hypothetical protein